MLQLMLDTVHEFGMMAGRIKQSFVKELLIFEQQSGRWEKLNSSNATWLNHHTNYQTWTPGGGDTGTTPKKNQCKSNVETKVRTQELFCLKDWEKMHSNGTGTNAECHDKRLEKVVQVLQLGLLTYVMHKLKVSVMCQWYFQTREFLAP